MFCVMIYCSCSVSLKCGVLPLCVVSELVGESTILPQGRVGKVDLGSVCAAFV